MPWLEIVKKTIPMPSVIGNLFCLSKNVLEETNIRLLAKFLFI